MRGVRRGREGSAVPSEHAGAQEGRRGARLVVLEDVLHAAAHGEVLDEREGEVPVAGELDGGVDEGCAARGRAADALRIRGEMRAGERDRLVQGLASWRQGGRTRAALMPCSRMNASTGAMRSAAASDRSGEGDTSAIPTPPAADRHAINSPWMQR